MLQFHHLGGVHTLHSAMSGSKSPLRYPGGKQKLAPFVLELLQANGLGGGEYAEPYAGGAGVAIELLLTKKILKIHLNDACAAVYDFWRSILTQTEDFCRLISRASLTIEEWRRQKDVLARPREHGQLERGFSLFYLNRCNRSGILNGGVIGGLEQKGRWKINARFPRTELIRRVENIADYRKSIVVKNLDAKDYLLSYVCKLPKTCLVYCDPPYFLKAERLYLNHYKPADHETIAKIVQSKLTRPWMVSYDNAPEIVKSYSKRRTIEYSLQYSAATAYKGKELIIFSDGLTLPKSSSLASVDTALRRLSA